MSYRRLGLCVVAATALVASFSAVPASAAKNIRVIDDSQLKANTTTVGGAKVLNSTNTIQHFHGQTANPHDGVTYGWNMAGVDPSSNGASTIDVDVIPVIVHVGGMTFDGNNVLAGTLASPQFQNNDYGSTPAATATGDANANPPTSVTRGPGGILSQGDAGLGLQLEDATMRAQFNKTGASSGYHLYLRTHVLPTVTLDAPSGSSQLLQSGRGVIFAGVDISWWATRIQNLMQSANPKHLPLYLTDSVLLYKGASCCTIGFHGAGEVLGHGTGSVNGNANQAVQTFAWASWIRPGIYARANGGTAWAVQDIHALSHEIAEWADDPFVNNKVEPWLTPTAPQYGCTDVLETGDPVVGIGFAMGNNTFDQTPNPNGTVSFDGYFHPEDEVFLPWFMRTAPNTISEPTQSPSANVGRYTLMGDLNPFPGFREPATGC
jgi:hypothetical protein